MKTPTAHPGQPIATTVAVDPARAAPERYRRPMQPDDLPGVLALQQGCYAAAFHEPLAAFASKLSASPDSCWVLVRGDMLCAYLVCLPIEGDQLPPLHAAHWSAPERPDWLYLHDMAVSPAERGTGAAQALLAQAFEWARQRQLPETGLIAVQGSVPFWSKLGFQLLEDPARVGPAKLATFGPDARFMRRDTPGHAS
jgi:GNAT superfamily N-acetyltransferase